MKLIINSTIKIILFFLQQTADSISSDDSRVETAYIVTQASIQNVLIKPSFYYESEEFGSIILKALKNKDGSYFERILMISKYFCIEKKFKRSKFKFD